VRRKVSWDLSDSVESLAKMHKDGFCFSYEQVMTFPETFFQRCWDDIEQKGPASVAVRLIDEVLKDRILEQEISGSQPAVTG
jgi:hypothetical protein